MRDFIKGVFATIFVIALIDHLAAALEDRDERVKQSVILSSSVGWLSTVVETEESGGGLVAMQAAFDKGESLLLLPKDRNDTTVRVWLCRTTEELCINVTLNSGGRVGRILESTTPLSVTKTGNQVIIAPQFSFRTAA